jgi:hypothetical protein
MLREIQRIAGAGDICRSRFEGRVYTFEDMVRGRMFNRGVDPGSPISVVLFKLFMNTDTSLTSLNEGLIWASCYSDDRAPIFSADDALSGLTQSNLARSYEWSRATGCEYHSHQCADGKIDKKGPKYLEFCKKSMQSGMSFDQLALGLIPVKPSLDMRELGLNVSTDRAIAKVGPIFDRYGYFFRPETSRLCAIAYRIQDIKYDYPPHSVRQMVACYFNGIARFGSSLYWSRSLKWELDRVRFYYAMSTAAVLRLSALDVLGPSCCKSRSVSSDNQDMHKLLSKVGFPSLLEMARTDSVAAVRQVANVWPDFFQVGISKRRTRKPIQRLGVTQNPLQQFNTSSKVISANLPTYISDEVLRSDALIGYVTRLAWEKVTLPRKVAELSVHWYRYVLDACIVASTIEKSIDYRAAYSTYQNLCLNEFGALEVQQRRARFLERENRLLADTTCKVAPPKWSRGPTDKVKWRFGCKQLPPSHVILGKPVALFLTTIFAVVVEYVVFG